MIELTLIQKIAIWAIPVLFAISLHEVAHGWVASFCGDHTAKLLGRLSINPLKHIDLVGTVLIPLIMLLVSNFIFGWARPVPVDPRNFQHPRRSMAIVALAGPIANLLMAVGWGGIAKLGAIAEQAGWSWVGFPLILMGGAGIMINVVLGLLNLIPLPPLDGGKILSALLPKRGAYYLSLIEPFSFFILVVLLFSGLLSSILSVPVFFLINLIGKLFGLA